MKTPDLTPLGSRILPAALTFLAAFAAAGLSAAGADFKVDFADCAKCPYRLRITADGASATVNLARLCEDSPDAEVLEARKRAMVERAKKLMGVAAATRAGDRAKRPLMGWSSWNTFAVEISEDIILSVARAMHTNGLQAAGYNYVNIDDGFFNGRDAEGHLRFHPRRFPNGLKGTVDGIHALGLKAGTYSDAGIDTCGSIWNDDKLGKGSGLYGHDADDLTLHFRKLGFDFIKVDYCGAKDQKLEERARYTEIANALRATGRKDARLNLCRWAFPGTWAADIAESWRTTRDIRANWTSVKELAAENLFLSAYASPGHYNDLDMLEVGLPKGRTKTAFKDDEGLTPEEELTHFGLWCIMSSPLLIGCDVRKMPAESLALVTNPFLLAMNQNDLGLAAHPVRREGDAWVLVKDADAVRGKARYVALYNAGDEPHDFAVDFACLELDGEVEAFDLAERADIGKFKNSLAMTVPAHATRFLRLDATRRLERAVYEAETAYLSEYQEVRDAKAAGTAFYQACAGAGAGHIVCNLGGRASNDMVWKDVFTAKPGPRTIAFRVRSAAAAKFLFRIDDGAAQTVEVPPTHGTFTDVRVIATFTRGSHRVRVWNPSAAAPDFDLMRLESAPTTVRVAWDETCGPVKPVNAVGQPPMIGGPRNFPMFKYLKDAGIPYARLHDVDGKFGANLYVDVPNLFRNFDADENDPANYDFAFTDALLRQLDAHGVEPWFRLGVTIENYPEFNRYRIFPPKDFAKWARICEHIVRHYTEGWANGLKLKIDYWEIWNEADLNPDKEKSMTWAGTFDEYCEFYAVAARHLKAKFPHLKIGGPASCGLYAAENPMARGRARYHADCCVRFLDYVKRHDLPMDFFSFHSYSTAKPAVEQIASARKLLVERGLGHVETWLNEWLCNPQHEHLGTALQASGVAAELIGMQNSELSGACIYDAKCGVGAYSPLFNPMTYRPHKAYYAFTAFNELRRRGTAVKVSVAGDGDVWACAAADAKSGALMLANASARFVPVDCSAGGAKVTGCRLTDAERTDAAVALPSVLPPYSFAVVLFDRL